MEKIALNPIVFLPDFLLFQLKLEDNFEIHWIHVLLLIRFSLLGLKEDRIIHT